MGAKRHTSGSATAKADSSASDNVQELRNHIAELKKQLEELKKVDKELLVSQTRLRRAELASKSGNWEYHLDTGTVIGSEGAVKLYGVKESQMDYSLVKAIPLPEYREMMDRALDDLINHGKPYNIEFKIRNLSTDEIIDIHSICEYDSKNRILFGSITDITDQKRADAEIREKNLVLASLLDVTLEILETVDRKKVLKKIVEGSIKLIGMDTAAVYMLEGNELVLEDTIPPLPDDFPEEFRRARLANHHIIKKVIESNTHFILKNAKTAELTKEERLIVETRGLYSILYIPLVAHKSVVGVLILGSDKGVHDFREHEIDLSRTLSTIMSLSLENSFLFENLTIAKNRAEESDRLKTAFLHNISHEIRTPLNAIIGFSGFLDQPDLKPDERKEYIDIIFRSNNELLSIINDILSISQIETGQVVIHESVTNVNQILKNLHRQYREVAAKARIEFRINNSFQESDALIDTDESKIIQIMTCLLNNAFKFTHEGFVEMGYQTSGDFAGFYVEDSGIGIPESEHEKIFERFYQIDKTITRIYSGTGLGLAISNAYVKLLGGDFSVRSSPGLGSRFSFRIPLKKPLAEVKTEAETTNAGKTGFSSLKTILVAEDEESNYVLITAILKNHGCRMIRAKNGQAAIDLCKSDPGIDLVLMDIKMPVMDGFEATSEILKFRPDLPIIAQTAYAHPTDRIRALELGCTDYLAKPFDRNQLLEMVIKYLK